MGKQPAWKQQQKWRADQQSAQWDDSQKSYWSYWQGAWPKPKQYGQGQEQGTGMVAFPSYHNMQVSSELRNPAAPPTPPDGADEGVGEPDRLKQIQKWINVVRRAEARIRKARESQQQRECQWAAYEAEVRAHYAKERKQYQEDCAKSKAELLEIKSQRAQAIVQLQACMTDAPMEVEGATQGLTAEDQQHWDALIGGTASTEDDSARVQSILHSAARHGPNALQPEERSIVQQWLQRHGEGSASLPPQPHADVSDPWGDSGPKDAELQRALASSLLGKTTVGLPATPARTGHACPRTPSVARPPVSLQRPGNAFSSRVAPFPPPARPPTFGDPLTGAACAAGSSGAAAPPVVDPYLFVGSPPQIPAPVHLL